MTRQHTAVIIVLYIAIETTSNMNMRNETPLMHTNKNHKHKNVTYNM